jgi:hypothetical protein
VVNVSYYKCEYYNRLMELIVRSLHVYYTCLPCAECLLQTTQTTGVDGFVMCACGCVVGVCVGALHHPRARSRKRKKRADESKDFVCGASGRLCSSIVAGKIVTAERFVINVQVHYCSL